MGLVREGHSDGVGDDVIDEGGAGGAGIAQIEGLHRCGAVFQDAGPPAQRLAVEIHQYVDFMGADQVGHRFIALIPDIGEMVTGLADAAIGFAAIVAAQKDARHFEAGAVVAFLILPTLWTILGSFSWAESVAHWADTNRTLSPLYDGTMQGDDWAKLLVSLLIWLALPMIVGIWRMTHSEVKSA